MNKRFYLITSILFIVLIPIIYIIEKSDSFSANVLSYGHVVILLLTLLSYTIGSRYATSESNGAFVRGVMGGTFLKFFLAIIFGFIYILLNKDNIKIADILGLMLIYIIYTTIETVTLAKASRIGK